MTYYYFDRESKMILINNFKEWIKGNGEGDALWRTSVAYIATGDKKYRQGILDAFQPNGMKGRYVKWQARRFNSKDNKLSGVDDVSRDQIILAWTSLYLNKDFEQLKILIKGTPFKLSKRYRMTPTMWLWSRGLIGNKLAGYFAQVFLSFELIFSVLLNKMIKSYLKWNEYSPDELEDLLETNGESIRDNILNTEFKKKLWKIEFPGYGLHLAAWMNFTGSNNFFKDLNNLLITEDMSKYNLLLKLLTRGCVIDEIINDYKPQEEWAWSGRFNEMSRARQIPKNMLNGKELDKLILIKIKDYIKETNL